MGWMFVLGICYGCRQPFTFAPNLVPSIHINGELEPICEDCVNRANPRRIANGLAPIVPLPGAYEPEEV